MSCRNLVFDWSPSPFVGLVDDAGEDNPAAICMEAGDALHLRLHDDSR